MISDSDRKFYADEYGIIKKREWEVSHSSLAKISEKEVTYEECRRYACEDIVKNLTKLPDTNAPFVVEIPANTEFHFIGRVATGFWGTSDLKGYNESFITRKYISFSTINHKNVSRYHGRRFLVYDIEPDDIVHIFPMDSSTETMAKSEKQLTILPSLWLTMHELEDLTLKLKVYNQITCKTKRNKKILRPFAIIAIGELDEETEKIAKRFGIRCIIIHPNADAVEYTGDLLYDWWKLQEVSEKMKELYGMNTRVLYEIP